MELSVLISPLTSDQEAYEKIFRWFSQPSAEFGYDSRTGNCVYRGGSYRTSDIRCAVGCLIPDELYIEPESEDHTGMENITADAAIQKSSELENYFSKINPAFLLECQQAHDEEAATNQPSILRFLLELNKIAAKHNLVLIAA